MRLIDADAYKILYGKECPKDCGVCDFDQEDCMCGLIDNEPTIDAVPVVRCKDCAYFHPYPFEPEYGSCKYHLGPDLQWEEKKETDYCSDAERLEDVG